MIHQRANEPVIANSKFVIQAQVHTLNLASFIKILTMNKLLSTLILSVGMSLSATAATSLLDSSIVGYSDFASQTADFGTLKDSVSITSDDSNLTLSGITFNGYGANNRDVMSVTMVLDLSKINTPDAYTALFNAKTAV